MFLICLFIQVEDTIRGKLITSGNELARDVVRNGEHFQLMSEEAMRHLIGKHALPLQEHHFQRLIVYNVSRNFPKKSG